MNQNIKKNIRLLASKYDHDISYNHDSSICVFNEINNIFIKLINKAEVLISYNLEKDEEEILIKANVFYDLFLNLLERNSLCKIELTEGDPLSLDDWFEHEGSFAKQQLKDLKNELARDEFTYKNLFGNRILVEFYSGILILTDDLCWTPSNIIELKKA